MEQIPTATQTAAHTTPQWKLATAAVVILLIVGAIVAYKFWPSRKAVTTPFQPMKITRLTNSGKAIDATLSPDGKYVVYVLSDAGTQSLWIRQVSTANDTQIVEPARVGFFGVTFSRDGNDIYYVVKQTQVPGILYRVPTLGGTPKKVFERIDGPISFSPDGKQFVLPRGNFPNPGESALVIANTDGSGERVLSVLKSPEYLLPIFYTGPSWSPDGKLIAAVVGRQQDYYVRTFAVGDGKETQLPDPWGFAARVEWLPDMSGLLVIAGQSVADSQVWFLSHPGGVKRKVTNDLNGYRALGVAADGTRFSTIQQSGLVNIWVVPGADAQRAVQLGTGNVGWSGGSNLSWTADNRLVFVSNESGSRDIWVMNADGTDRKQLTANAGNNTGPVVTNDNRFILFSSERPGGRHIWRMDLDGNNPRQLTNGNADFYPAVTPDGKWVFYTSISEGTPRIWRVSIDGGTATQFSNKVGLAPQVSPDGKSVAFMFPTSEDPTAPPNRIGIMPIEGGEATKVFPFQVGRTNSPHLVWSPDGRSIIYAVSDNVTNLWSQPIDGSEPKKITDFKDSLMTGFAWTRDGKILACTRGVLMRDAVLISEAE
jgi:Tol biopolymer transport system component